MNLATNLFDFICWTPPAPIAGGIYLSFAEDLGVNQSGRTGYN